MDLLFVCLGNICRSPMSERVAETHIARRGLDLTVASAGTSDEETGNPIDRRAARVLARAGHRTDGHRAHQVTPDELRSARLVIAAEAHQVDHLLRLAPEANVRLFSDFDPEASLGDPLPDPWFGGMDGFDTTLAAVERAMPAILDEVERTPIR